MRAKQNGARSEAAEPHANLADVLAIDIIEYLEQKEIGRAISDDANRRIRELCRMAVSINMSGELVQSPQHFILAVGRT